MTRLSPASLILAALTLAVAGCSSTPATRFYSLASIAPAAPESPRPAGQGLAVAVGTVTLPAYLDRPQVVTRPGVYAVHLAEFDRWSEPLQDMVPRVIAENLSVLLGSDQVYLSPRRRPNQDTPPRSSSSSMSPRSSNCARARIIVLLSTPSRRASQPGRCAGFR